MATLLSGFIGGVIVGFGAGLLVTIGVVGVRRWLARQYGGIQKRRPF